MKNLLKNTSSFSSKLKDKVFILKTLVFLKKQEHFPPKNPSLNASKNLTQSYAKILVKNYLNLIFLRSQRHSNT